MLHTLLSTWCSGNKFQWMGKCVCLFLQFCHICVGYLCHATETPNSLIWVIRVIKNNIAAASSESLLDILKGILSIVQDKSYRIVRYCLCCKVTSWKLLWFCGLHLEVNFLSSGIHKIVFSKVKLQLCSKLESHCVLQCNFSFVLTDFFFFKCGIY